MPAQLVVPVTHTPTVCTHLIHHLDLDSLSRLAAKLAYHFYLLQHRATPAFLSDRILRGSILILDTRSLSGFA